MAALLPAALDQQDGKDENEWLVYELMVKMTCEGCGRAVKGILDQIDSSTLHVVDIDVPGELVIVRSTLPHATVLKALRDGGREVALVGTGSTADLSTIVIPKDRGTLEENLSCIGEFKGKYGGQGSVMGVVRVIQKTPRACVVHASLSGLKPGEPHAVAVHEFGSIFHASSGPLFQAGNGTDVSFNGLLGTAVADAKGNLEISGPIKECLVWQLVGRSIVIHQADQPDKATSKSTRVSSSIIARSALVGENHKKVCLCDGTVLWAARSEGPGT